MKNALPLERANQMTYVTTLRQPMDVLDVRQHDSDAYR
jgi:hypothetical protein